MNILTVLLAVIGVFAAYYVYLGPSDDPGPGRNLASVRFMLAAVGLLFGGVFALVAANGLAEAVLILILGFGLVHIPAAAILLLKRGRPGGPPPR